MTKMFHLSKDLLYVGVFDVFGRYTGQIRTLPTRGVTYLNPDRAKRKNTPKHPYQRSGFFKARRAARKAASCL